MFKTLKIAVACSLAALAAACADAEMSTPATGQLNTAETQAYADAIAHFERMVTEKPDEIEGVLGLARNLRWAGRAADAAKVLEDAGPRFGTNGRYLAELGKVRLSLGDTARGVARLREATATAGDDWRLYSALGIGLDHQENYPEAQAAYRKALDMCPDDAAVMNNLGISQALSGKMDHAVLTLEQALMLKGHAEKIRSNLKLVKSARDLCPSCGAHYLKQSGSMILAAGLKGTDREGPCTPEPAYTEVKTEMVTQLAEAPSINIKVYFEFDSAILKPEAMDILDNLGEALTSGELKDFRFEIAGHTDAVGTEPYNLDLSERRAKSVLDYLVVTFGIDARRIDTVGYGENRLLDPTDPEGDVNRRVQVTRLGRMEQ